MSAFYNTHGVHLAEAISLDFLAALSDLTEHQREVFVDSYLCGMDAQTIADDHGIGKKAVYQVRRVAREKVRKNLGVRNEPRAAA
jgi:RNA polymerase sigma factor (sigma-70 family)